VASRALTAQIRPTHRDPSRLRRRATILFSPQPWLAHALVFGQGETAAAEVRASALAPLRRRSPLGRTAARSRRVDVSPSQRRPALPPVRLWACMPPRVCLAANSIHYPSQLWPYLNWALSLRSAGCELTWLEMLEFDQADSRLEGAVVTLRRLLAPYALGSALVLATAEGDEGGGGVGTLQLEAALGADLLVDLGYLPSAFARRFRRSVFVDLDPGQAQIWAAAGDLDLSGRDVYVSIGDGVLASDRPFPDAGFEWRYVPTPVHLEAWSPKAGPAAPADAPFTTISHWWAAEAAVEIGGEWVEASKADGFEPFLRLPALTDARLELALGGLNDDQEQRRLERLGWTIRDAAAVVPTPQAYCAYIYASRGEFTAAKPPYVRLQTGWLNDRTASYLATGRPAIVQRTLRRSAATLPEGEGLLRFDTLPEAAEAIAAVQGDYARHAEAARTLAEEHFDGRKVAARVLELALP
jgi:hypothetical protein